MTDDELRTHLDGVLAAELAARAAALSGARDANTHLSARLDDADRAIVEKDRTISLLEHGLTLSNAENVQLRARIAELEQGQPTVPPPVWDGVCLYGTGLWWPKAGASYPDTYRTHVERVGKGKRPDMLRTFGTSNDGRWTWAGLQGGASGTSSPTVTGHDGGNWHSFKTDLTGAATGRYNTNWTASIKTIPVDGRLKIITIHHEPENDLPASNYDAWALNWMKANIEVGKAIKAANHPEVMFAPIFMGSWYISGVPDTHPSDLDRWMRLADANGLRSELHEVWDFIGWDPYHEGSTKSPPQLSAPRNDMKHYLDPCLAFTEKYFPGKPMGVGETGFYNTIAEATRLAILKTIPAWVDQHPGKVVAVCYFDASIQAPWYLSLGTDGLTTSAYQRGPAEYWGSLYT